MPNPTPFLRRPAPGILLLAALVGLNSHHPLFAEQDTGAGAGHAADARLAGGGPPAQRLWRIKDRGEPRAYELALNHAVKRDADGTESVVEFDPAADASGLAARLAAVGHAPGGVFPVVHPSGEPRTAANRRLVTADIRVRVPEAQAREMAESLGLRVKDIPEHSPGWVVLSAKDPMAALQAAEKLQATPGVPEADVLLAATRFKRALPNDPLVTSQWHLKKTSASSTGTDVNIESAWNYGGSGGMRGSGIRIGIIDDGLQTNHPDFVSNIDTANDKDWNGNDDDPSPGTDDDHGTSCGGNAAARGNNGIGVTGTAPEATLVGLRLIAGSVTDAQEAEAMSWRNDIIQVKSNSWGPDDSGTVLEAPGPLTQAAFASAAANGRGGRGTIILFAAGNGGTANDNSNYDGYGNSIHTIAVGAFDSLGRRADYSERGANILLCAPSDGASPALGITTVDRTGSAGYNGSSSASGGDYTSDFGGTSSATPTAAGIVALVLQKNPNLGWRDVQEVLIRSAAKCRPTDAEWITNGAGFHFNHNFGAGLIDATAAVNLAGTWTNLAPATNTSLSQTSLSVAIPENNSTGVTRTFSLPASNLRVEHVTVTVNINHTARGNLAITLTSPAGTQSKLAEVHGDANDNFPAWTFSSVRHWGESSNGNWTLHIADLSGTSNTTGGTLTSASLTLHGTPLVPVNPPPVVQLTSPADGAVLSTGAQVAVAATASDVASNGSTGVITQVEFLVDGQVFATDNNSPYQATYSTTVGSHSLTARATDSQGGIGVSGSRTISVSNLAPSISSATLSATGQAYADLTLSVNSITASDPEGGNVGFSYQWQNCTDGVVWQDAAKSTGVNLPAAPANAGKLWRCVITPSDGITTGAPYTTAAVNLLTRPITTALPGQSWSYQSGLVLRGTNVAVTRRAIISEFSQGPPGGTSEWIEILVMKSGGLAFWDLSDSGNILVFLDDPVWSNIPVGTLIVIYNGATTKDPKLPADDLDSSDGKMVVSSTNPNYFDNSYDAWIPLGNSGDTISLSDENSNVIHALSFGSSTGITPNVGSVPAGYAAWMNGGSEASSLLSSGWTTGAASSAAVTPGFGNGGAHSDFVAALRAGVVSQPAAYQIGAGATIPAGLSLNSSTGLLSGVIGTGVANGNYLIIIERVNSLNEVVSQSFTLTIGAATGGFASWLSGYPTLADTSADGDPDKDGLATLFEYISGRHPGVAEPSAAITFAKIGNALTLTWREKKSATGATVIPEWSTNPSLPPPWQTTGITLELLEDTTTDRLRRATLPISPSHPSRFLRLRAVTTP